MNEKIKKYLKIVLIVIASVLLLKFAVTVVQIIIFVYEPPAITKDAMEKEFVENRDMILEVVQFLEEEKWETIVIRKTYYDSEKENKMFVFHNNQKIGYIPIENQHISEVIRLLFEEYNFEVISKDEEGITLQRWASLEYSRGIVYAPDGEPDAGGLITILEPLEEDGWYFYEQD